MEGREWQGDIQKAMKNQAERRAREAYLAERLETKRIHLGIPLAELGTTVGGGVGRAGVTWDIRIWRSQGGKGKKGNLIEGRSKLWWNHYGSGEVRARSLKKEIEKLTARLSKFPNPASTEYKRLEKGKAALEEKLEKINECPHCFAEQNDQWHILGECPHPALVEAR
jgi:hypothetical protein